MTEESRGRSGALADEIAECRKDAEFRDRLQTRVREDAAILNRLGGADVACDAKIRPFPNDTELTCEKVDPHPHDEHFAVLRDYAYPGSSTTITWAESDRRTFRGVWRECDLSSNVLPCVLPAGHRGNHAQ